MRSNRGSLRHASAANRRSLSDASAGTCATPAAVGTADQYARVCFQNSCCMLAICCVAAMKSPIGLGLPGSAVLGMPRPKDCSIAWPPSSRLASSCAGSFVVLAMDGSSTLAWTQPRAGGAIADGENVFVARGLQRGQYHELIDAIRLQAVEVLQKFRRFHAGGPDDQLGRNGLSSGEPHARRQDLGHARGRPHIHLQLREQL